jgi:thioredoxin-dependent peroxiredoxin
MPKPGDPFPDFELSNQDGNPVRLSDYRGRKLIVFAFPKANTPGCTTQACGFRDEFPKIEAGNAAVLGVSPDPPKKLRAWKDAQNLPYELLSDPDHRLLDALGAWGERSMYGKKYMGVIRSHWVIDEHGIVLDEQIKTSPTESVARALKTVAG